ncbi:hypothetical protein LES60_06745 [Pectobacterium brasiliense]|nr:hypothetical protein [Pectobacterium brasiliense]MBN3343977.1 hypothetical protein [Pectobacterium brasiliense]MCA5919265.1 hypothetical protein [Pectobacterium brasiliense]MCA5926348.1 hypothetical protein [Pectobacterium brasiliense]MCA5935636.1 hypothetical protein [Pectobacterium brasiliense]MCA5941567.1 hypothetical protein [Pectobacterium brasiliense]
MLDNYYTDKNGLETDDEGKRLSAVQAALEIIKAAAPNDSVSQATFYTVNDVAKIADAIQSALKEK